MLVIYYDVQPTMCHGMAQAMETMNEVLSKADFVSIHVPDAPETRGLISSAQLELMRPGSYLINASRGKVVDLEALKRALNTGHLAGAALDVYPTEPERNGSSSIPCLQVLADKSNVILTPHIGKSVWHPISISN